MFEGLPSPDRSAPVRQTAANDAKPRRVREPTHPLLVVRGMNGNSVSARKYREIALAMADEAGGLDKLTAPTMALIRQAASMTLKIEDMTMRAVAGEDVDLDDITRASNSLNRIVGRLDRIGIQSRTKAPIYSVADYMELKARRAADVEEAD
jgi:hypothetical protein